MSRLSVVIVNYNAGYILRDSIVSLLGSAHVSKVIVIDNFSRDGSMDEVERLAISDSRLQCIRNEKNLGFAKACNIGITLAGESDYLLFFNPDSIMCNNALDRMLDCMESFPQTGMAGPVVFNPDGSEQAGGRRAVPTPWLSFVRAFGLSRLHKRYPKLFSDFLLHEQPLSEAPAEVEAISGSCMLVRRKALLKIGPLDEGYFMHCEDLDWCMRFRSAGWKIMFVPEASVVHYKGTCGKARPIFVEWHKHIGMMRFYSKFFRHQYPGPLFWIVVIGVWLRFGALFVYYGFMNIRKFLNHDR